jgi:hypothetical protein
MSICKKMYVENVENYLLVDVEVLETWTIE